MGFPLANGSIPGFRLRPWIWKVPTPPPNGLRRVDGGLLFPFPEHPARPGQAVRAGLAASQTAQLAGSQARSRPVYQRAQAGYPCTRPAQEARAAGLSNPARVMEIGEPPTSCGRACGRAGAAARAPVREPGGAAGEAGAGMRPRL
jgi:hypothetical protein